MASGGETQEEISTATTPDLLGYGFAAVVVVGGLMGFRKGSKQSLEAGLLAGIRVIQQFHATLSDGPIRSNLILIQDYFNPQSKPSLYPISSLD